MGKHCVLPVFGTENDDANPNNIILTKTQIYMSL